MMREESHRDNRFKIRPFSKFKASTAIKALMSCSPVVAAPSSVRSAIRRSVQRLQNMTMGIISIGDAEKILGQLMALHVEAEYAYVSAITIISHATERICDPEEYKTFSDICLPVRGSGPRSKNMLWTQSLNDAVARHFESVGLLRSYAKSIPKWRHEGHDYCEDMLEMCVRIIMRPGITKFSRGMEVALGWPSEMVSGVIASPWTNTAADLRKSKGTTQ